MNTKETLISAKSLIDTPKKWGKGQGTFTYHGQKETCISCAHEALRKTVGQRVWDTPKPDGVVEALRMELPKGFSNTPDYNDHPDTTHADIMALYDRAIANAD